jgi:3-deoxy-7-phosphoheptulonate synthase
MKMMVIVMQPQATAQHIQQVIDRIHAAGLNTHLVKGEFQNIIGVLGDKKIIVNLALEAFPGVEKILSVSAGYKLVSREFRSENTVVDVGGVKIGDGSLVVMAGPCAVESREQLLESAHIVKATGARFLRGGAFKPRTSPYSFQGLEQQGLEYLAEAAQATGLKIVTEVMDVASVDMLAEYADMLQIGARNMQNFHLLRAVGRSGKPVLLKRGLSATIDEWLHATEYILNEGNFNVVLCERGIRTYEDYTRNTLDLSAVAAVKHLSHLPIIVDPSHATGLWRMVKPMSLAAVAAGADGLMIEVHPNPANALSDGPQSLTPENFTTLMKEVDALAAFLRQQS